MTRRNLLALSLTLAAVGTRCGSNNATNSLAVIPSHAIAQQTAVPGTPAGPQQLSPPSLDPGTPVSASQLGPLAGLPPEDPNCVGFTGPGDTCWGEWLKEMGNTNFTAVAKGALGAGPWPTTTSTMMGTAQGLQLPVLYVGVDTAENIYAVSDGAFFVRRAGQATFEEYDQNTNGLKDYPFLSVAGQAPGVAYVGHVGITPPSEFNDPPTDGLDLLQSGGIDKVVLTPQGISVTPYWTHNSNSPSGAYSHDRTLYNLFVPRRGPAAGELYSSSEHCITRRIDDTHWASHRHIEVDYGGSAHYGMARAVTVTDDGYMWYGSDYEFGSLQWQPRLYEWYFNNDWILPTNVYGSEEEQDWYRGIGVDSKGNVYAAANGNGIALLSNVNVNKGHTNGTVSTIDPPDYNMNSLVVDTDDSVWVGADGGLYRYAPATQKWTNYPDAGGGISYVFLDDTVTPRAIYAATAGGIWVYRGQ